MIYVYIIASIIVYFLGGIILFYPLCKIWKVNEFVLENIKEYRISEWDPDAEMVVCFNFVFWPLSIVAFVFVSILRLFLTGVNLSLFFWNGETKEIENVEEIEETDTTTKEQNIRDMNSSIGNFYL